MEEDTRVIPLDSDYKKLIQPLKDKVVSARMRAMLAVNFAIVQQAVGQLF